MFTAGGASTNSVTLINIPGQTTSTYLTAAYAAARDQVCQSYIGTTMCVSMPISVITAYTLTGGASASLAWSTQFDTTVDGWFGLAIDNTSAATKGANYLFAMNAVSKMDSMTFGINIDYQMSTSTVVIGETFATPMTYSYSSTVGFQASIGGVMITTYPSPLAILSTSSWVLDSKVAKIDSATSTTIIP